MPRRCAGSCPTCAGATRTCAARRRSPTPWPAPCARPASTTTASISNPSPSRRPRMKRAPIVIGSTVFGTAAVLSLHAHPATVPTATASSKSTQTTTTPTTTTPSSGSSGASGSGTALGDVMQTRYGPAQVRVTVSAGKITKVEAVQLQSGDPKSAEISSYAEPILQQSVLSKQTAAVDTVSGATYTSLSYEGSLQSALDKLGFKASDGSTASTDTSQLQ